MGLPDFHFYIFGLLLTWGFQNGIAKASTFNFLRIDLQAYVNAVNLCFFAILLVTSQAGTKIATNALGKTATVKTTF